MAGARSSIKAGDAYVLLGVEMDKTELKELQGIQDKLEEGTRMMNAGKMGAMAFVATGAAIGFATSQAGDYAAEMKRTELLVGEAWKKQIDWAETYANATGYARAQTLETTNIFLAMAKGMGIGGKEGVKFSRQMTVMTQDFATFSKIPMSEAILRMKSAMSGSGEVLDMFGINVKQTALDAELLAQGFKSTAQGATEQEKMFARAAIIQRSLAEQGAAGAAVWMRTYPKAVDKFRGSLSDLMVAIGNAFLPIVTVLVDLMARLVRVVARFALRAKPLVLIIGVLTMAFTGLFAALFVVGAAMWAYAKVQATVLMLKKSTVVANLLEAGTYNVLAGAIAKTKVAALASVGPLGIIIGLFAAMGLAVGLLADEEDPIRKFWEAATNPNLDTLTRLEALFRFVGRSAAWLENRVLNLLGPLKKAYLWSQKMNPMMLGASKIREWIFGETGQSTEEFDEETNKQVGAFQAGLGDLDKDEWSTGTSKNQTTTKLPEALEYGTRKAMEIFYRKSDETKQLDELKRQTALLEVVAEGIDGMSGATTRSATPYKVSVL